MKSIILNNYAISYVKPVVLKIKIDPLLIKFIHFFVPIWFYINITHILLCVGFDNILISFAVAIIIKVIIIRKTS